MAPVDFSRPGGVPVVTRNAIAKLANTLIASAGLVLVAGSMAWAQTGKSLAPNPSTPNALVTEVSFLEPQWNELNPGQQRILQPLAGKWNDLPSERKSKWLALAQRYPTLPPEGQAKLQSRMSEWAALKPRDRERARLNYAETKKLSPHERNADWEAYQALSPEEKRRLAAKAAAKPTSAALAVKPLPESQLTPVPLTRRHAERNAAPISAKPILDRNTLLPLAPRATPAQPAPGK
jgi:hypothetical protein